MNQEKMPILEMLHQFASSKPLSFHVPGHKHGTVFPSLAEQYFKSILQIDVTELPGLDDLHAPHGAIFEAEKLASDFFQSDHTFFLINGSTVGNLAMILAACSNGDKVIVQRNCHKSIMNGLELAGVQPIFLAPEYDEQVQRFTQPTYETLEKALAIHDDAKAIILTYPDYFGRVYEIKAMIDLAHQHDIPVLVDEAHGVHFSLEGLFPPSALQLGADIVVHSAHKTIPAMTMASYLHVKSKYISQEKLSHYLQILQSSSPSYPLMASLDIARAFLAQLNRARITEIVDDMEKIKQLFHTTTDPWKVIHSDDPLKLTIQLQDGYSAKEAAQLFEEQGVYPELTTDRQILFIFGLAPFTEWGRLKKVLKYVRESLKNKANHATIEVVHFFTETMQSLALSYKEMEILEQRLVPFHAAIGEIAAEPVVPYPPGIPFILKGEKITPAHVQAIEQWSKLGVRIQQRSKGVRIFNSN